MQIAADCAQRKHHQGQRQQEFFLPLVHRRRGGFVPAEPAKGTQGSQRSCRQSVGRIGKPHRVGPQHRQPHHQEKTQTQAQIDPQHGLAAGQQHPCQEYAPRQKEQQIQNSQHFRRALLSSNGVQGRMTVLPLRGPGRKAVPMSLRATRSLMRSCRFSRPEAMIAAARPWVSGFT